MIRKILKIALRLVVLGLIVLIAASYVNPPRVPVGEVVAPDEEIHLSQMIDSGLAMVKATRQQVGDGLYRRDAHAKTTGCALANFTVKPPSDDRTHQGLFAEAKTYKAWIRWSNSSTSIQSDWIPDARGMAIKVLGVPGLKLLEGEENERTQDFVMVNNPVFVVRNVDEYATLTRFLGVGSEFGYFFQGSNPSRWELRALRLSLGILKFPRNLLASQFFSQAAYRLGTGNYVKYSAKPVACSAGGDVPSQWPGFGYDALREKVTGELKSGSKYCFDFMVQFQRPDQYMPVEDVTVEWQQSASPFVPVARIEIDRQDVDQNLANNFCENLSMSPWHALPQHQPVGGLNRIREMVYQGSSRYRRCKNGIAFGEPLDDGSRVFDTKPCDPHEAVPVINGGGRGKP